MGHAIFFFLIRVAGMCFAPDLLFVAVKLQFCFLSSLVFYHIFSFSTFFVVVCRVNQQVQNYKTCLKNSRFGVEKFNFSLGLSFNFFCIDIILLSV